MRIIASSTNLSRRSQPGAALMPRFSSIPSTASREAKSSGEAALTDLEDEPLDVDNLFLPTTPCRVDDKAAVSGRRAKSPATSAMIVKRGVRRSIRSYGEPATKCSFLAYLIDKYNFHEDSELTEGCAMINMSGKQHAHESCAICGACDRR